MHVRLKRPIAAFVSLWFLLVMIEPEAVHSCPVHTAASPSASAGHSGHHAADAGQSETDKPSHAICSCPGDCNAPAPRALPQAIARLDAIVVLRSERALRTEDGKTLDRFYRLLPFAIGPPTLTA